MDNVIIANFNGHLHAVTDPLWRYDEGMRLQFEGVDLPAAYQVHFSNEKDGDAIPVYGDETGAEIPYELLEDGYNVYAWVYVTGDGYGRTKCVAQIPVMIKARPSEEEPSPVQQSALDEAINAVNEAAENLETATENIPSEINAALEAAKASGEFDGDPGDDGNGVWLVDVQYTRTISAGAQAQLDHMVGRPGATPAVGDLCVVSDGRFGVVTSITPRVAVVPVLGDLSGADGYSPVVTITEIEGGHRITITDEAHPDGQSFDVMDGSGGVGTIDSDFSTTSENPVQNKVITAAFNTALQQLQALGLALDDKVNKVSGKGLSTNDFTDSDKAKLDDAATEQWVTQQGYITDAALGVYRTAQAQDVIDQQQNTAIAAKYSKPSGGIPKTDLASAVQTSLGKADTALQSAPVTSVNGQTGAVTVAVPTKTSDLTNDSGFVNAAGAAAAAPVSSVNGQTGAVSLSIPSTSADVGAIAAPASPASGAFLVWNGSAWVAQTLATWQASSY